MNERQARMAARIMLHNKAAGPAPAADHVEYCGRGPGSVLGNPFTSKAHTRVPGTTVVASRDEAIACHRAWMREQLRQQTGVYRRVRALARLVAAGKTVCLVCSCVPARCHTETIREAVAWYAAREGTSLAAHRSSESPQKP